MHLSSVCQLAKQYLFLGIIAALSSVLLMVFGYLIYLKYFRKEDGKLPWTNFTAGGMFVCYFGIVVGATMLSRSRLEHGIAQLRLFETYRDAWYQVDMVQWRNLFLNVLMFVPIGFLLPFTLKIFRKWWVTYIAGFVCTLVIESSQYIFLCGAFQTDDLLNNFVGGMIGFGFFTIVIFAKDCILHRKKHVVRTLLPQVPLLVAVISLLSICFVYETQEYGNLACENVIKQPMSNVELSVLCNVSEKRSVYDVASIVKNYNEQEVRQRASEVLSATGKKLAESDQVFYDDRARFYSEDGKAAIWVSYQGGTIEYEDYTEYKNSCKEDIERDPTAKKEDIFKILRSMKLLVPKECTFKNMGAGNYEIVVNRQNIGEKMIGGRISCQYTMNGKLALLKYYIFEENLCKKCKIYSQKDIYEMLKNGQFACVKTADTSLVVDVDTLSQMCVSCIELEGVYDSKGYCQPVYKVGIIGDGKEKYVIDIPARIK